ncbi:atp18 subunit J of the mitochondrial F1F0 ATP synthase [Lecanicillium sp. MT-2017a]|nr:atp18 subunit J of the mitochondrial F1F0 ATP synthase [Lecanicillium sp. MT-2017a]
MSWLGVAPFKKFPAPFMKPYWPFFAAGLVIAYGANSAQNAMMACTIPLIRDLKKNPRD